MSAQIYTNARIWTGASAARTAEAIGAADGRIVAVGSEEEVRAALPGAESHDLGGRMVMPGIHDAHIHILLSGLKFRFECRLRLNATAPQVAEDLCDCPACQSGKLGNWVIGGEVNPLAFEGGTYNKAFLDESFPDRPVLLYDYTTHNALVNSAALDLAGITAETPDPDGGRIIRDPETNEPTGALVERATWAAHRARNAYSDDVYREAVVWALKEASRFGITSIQEASASLPELTVLSALDAEGALPLRVASHLVWREEAYGGGVSQADLDRLIARRVEFGSPRLRTDFAKCWMDGQPLPPYFTQCDITENNEIDRAKLVISEDDLAAQLVFLDREGVTMKIHCAGMGAVRAALNAIEKMRAENGDGGPFHEIAHAGFVHPDDLPRLSRLRAVAEMSPALWHMKTPEFEPLKYGFKFRTMIGAGAHLTVGSDWIISENPNLFPALAGMLDRGDESISLAEALCRLTRAGAEAVDGAEQFGTLEPGKSADFIVLDRDLFAIPIEDIAGTIVLNTVFEGRVVHADAAGPLVLA